MMLRRPLLSAMTLTFFTFLMVLVANYLPYSEARDAITDAITLPGGFMASLVYPQGVHTGHGAPYWGLLAAISNLSIYLLFWYACLRTIGHFVHRRAAIRSKQGT